ncbi:MAG TPA: hypothetical protein VLW17_11075 [Thermoanaerobaculaceae bacterium]|nr:hypothetical protein [Thermoanaerobaculaceae bacterium]
MSVLAGGAAIALLGGAALTVPVAPRLPAAPDSPLGAAARGEREVPSLGLTWGRLRGWERTGAGWTLVWQPVHGAWLIRAWVPDGGDDVRWRLEAAPWLPGVRLGREAARAMAPAAPSPPIARDRVGRRDWVVGGERLLGALDGGGPLPRAAPAAAPAAVGLVAIQALLGGLLLAGAAARRLVPGVASRAWRRGVAAASLALTAAVPLLGVLAPHVFEPGVRPWVAELAFGTGIVMILGALAFAAQRFPAMGGAPAAGWLAAAGAGGVLAGRIDPVAALAALAGSPLCLPVCVAAAVLAGWLAGLAGDGLGQLVRAPAVLRFVVLGVIGVGATLAAGPWLGFVVAVVAAAAVGRGGATAMATAVLWGWEVGVTRELCRWERGQLDAAALLLLGCVALGAAFLWRRRTGDPAAQGAA